MGCDCGEVSRTDLWTSIPKSGLTEMLPGEDVECYAQRAPDDEDKAGQPELENKIKTNAIVPDCAMKIDVQFELTAGSPSGDFTGPVTWVMADPNDKTGTHGAYTISGLKFTSSGHLSGQMDAQAEGKTFNVLIIAKDSKGNEIDSRSYNFSPKKCKPGTDLKFIHPLPGARVTCGFGPRHPPTAGASSMHKGVDLAYPGGVTKDVLAACDGKVIKAGVGTGYGNVVYISHSNGSGKEMAETRYAHLERIYVSAGQQVSAGTPVGHEGHTGIGTGSHLHFEIRLAGDRPVDPLQYISGTILVSNGQTDPANPTGSTSAINNQNVGLTTAKVDSLSAGCKNLDTSGDLSAPPDKQIIGASRASCRPATTPTKDQVIAIINKVLDKHPDLDSGDRQFIIKTAQIESSYDPYAKNPNTSATGLFQMVDGTANGYYKKIGVEPTCENRCDPEKSTEAMIRFYKDAILKFYNEFKSRHTIAGKSLTPALIQKYDALTKPEFCYGLIHHDGVGNAVKGVDRQGVQIARSRFGSNTA
jgi:hypothetical protein